MPSRPGRSRSRKKLYCLFLLLAICLHLGLFLQFHTKKFAKYFFTSKRPAIDIATAHNLGEYKDWIYYIRQITPPDSLVILPDFNRHKSYIVSRRIGSAEICDYFLFPRQSAHLHENKVMLHNGPVYAVNVGAVHEFSGPSLKKYTLNRNFSLSLIRERRENVPAGLVLGRKNSVIPAGQWPVPLNLILLCLSGMLVVPAVLKKRVTVVLADSFLAGTALFTVFYIVSSFLGATVTPALQAVYFILTIIPGVILFAASRLKTAADPAVLNKQHVMCAGVVVLFFAALFIISMQVPLGRWDYWAIWGLKAKVIAVYGSLEGLKFWGRQLYYPPLVPVLFGALAGFKPIAIKIVTIFFAISLYFILQREIAKTTKSVPIKLFVPLLVFTTNVFAEHSMWGYANIVLAVFISRAVFLTGDLLRGRVDKGWGFLAVVLCGVVLARPEGILYCMLLTGIIFFAYIHKSAGLKDIRLLLIPYLVFCVWCSYVFFVLSSPGLELHDTGIVLTSPGIGYQFYVYSLFVFLKHMFSFARWGLIPVLFIFLFAWHPRRLLQERGVEVCFVFISAIGLLTFSSYVASGWGGAEFYSDTGLVRYCMTLIPVMFIVVFEQAARIAGIRQNN